MANILNTTKLNYHLERIIEEATSQITIVSPYLKIHSRLMNQLAEKVNADVALTVVYGKTQLDEVLMQRLSELDAVTLFFCPKLHAKIYANGDEAIVASLNLYEFSQINNYELGVLIGRGADAAMFSDVMTEIEMIKKASSCQKQRVQSAAPFASQYEKLSVTHLARLLKIKNADVFHLLQKEGLIVRQGDEWHLTAKGRNYGGEVVQSRRFGEYIVWPRDIVEVQR
jgi:hypothetical protein